MANTTLPGLQAEPVSGRVKWSFIDHTGPASYVNPGGDPFPTQSAYGGPNNAGLSGVYFVVPTWSQDGTYYVQAKYAGLGSISSAMKLHWYVAATGAEVANATNLSGETVRLMILGG
jgi:hypothetical protein